MLSIDGAVREAFLTRGVYCILIRRKDVRIHHAPADKEDEYFRGADCDSHGQGTRRYVCRFLFAFGTMVTIGLVYAHYGFLPDENGSLLNLIFPYSASLPTKSTNRDPPPSAS
jgi:hypothetical protein